MYMKHDAKNHFVLTLENNKAIDLYKISFKAL